MISYDFSRHAERLFLKLPKDIQKQILTKLEYCLAQPNPLASAERIYGSAIPAYRFRMGDYRIVFDWEKNRILITKVGHRREVYRR